ncbi:MAG: iron uptake porin [Nostocaceae cyanobacterium]|nr:iron uptake porin [Nostocaceae cyanobacterium]
MKLSVKECLSQGIRSPKLLTRSLLSCGIFSPLCWLSKAHSLPISVLSDTKPHQAYILSQLQDNSDVGCIPAQISPPETDTELLVGEFSQNSDGDSYPLGYKNITIPSPSLGCHNFRVERLWLLEEEKQPITPNPPFGVSGFSVSQNNANVDIITPDVVEAQTSVSELSDVQPTDWAYQALRSLIERYGILCGYSDGTFRGYRSLSRYEFAAALAATIEKIESLINNSAISEQYVQQDAIIVQRLQRDFAEALRELQLRTKLLESRTDNLEAEQFSTTTKLQGQSIFALSDGHNANSTIINRTRLTLSTTFKQGDLLVTQLESGNNGVDAITKQQRENLNLLGTRGLIANGGGLDYVEVADGVNLRRLYYTFLPLDDLAVTVGAKISPRDFIDRNSYANNEAIDFSSSFFLNNPLIVQNQIDSKGGAGFVLDWHPQGSQWNVRSLYIDADTGDDGLFGDNYQVSVEVEYLPTDNLKLRLQYTNAIVNSTDINALGINAEYTFDFNTGIFARLGYGSYQGFNSAINQDLNLHPFSWSLGLGIRNVLLPGTMIGMGIGQPFVTDGLGNSTQTNLETFYNLRLSENLSITPIFSLVFNADNDSDNGTIWQTTLRSVFSF